MALMTMPTLLPDDSGILWEDPSSDSKILWAFKKSKIPLKKKSMIFNHLCGKNEGESEIVRTEKYSVYSIKETVHDQP